MSLVHAAHGALLQLPSLSVDTPIDLATQAATINTIMGGVIGGLTAVIAGALAIRGVRWGVPKIVAFFSKLA